MVSGSVHGPVSCSSDRSEVLGLRGRGQSPLDPGSERHLGVRRFIESAAGQGQSGSKTPLVPTLSRDPRPVPSRVSTDRTGIPSLGQGWCPPGPSVRLVVVWGPGRGLQTRPSARRKSKPKLFVKIGVVKVAHILSVFVTFKIIFLRVLMMSLVSCLKIFIVDHSFYCLRRVNYPTQ